MSTPEEQAAKEIVLLEHDARLIVKVMVATLQDRPLDTPSGDHGNYFAVTGDLWRRLCEFALNVALILRHGAYPPAVVVVRTEYELAVNLIYLITQGNKVRNGVLFRTRSLLEVAEVLKDQPAGGEAQRILATVPEAIVEEAREYKRTRRPWSGKFLGQMATDVGMDGHRALYAVQSWEAHGLIAGYDVEEVAQVGDLRRMKFEGKRKPHEIEALALTARRILHLVYWTISRDWLGSIPRLDTSNPFEDDPPRGSG